MLQSASRVDTSQAARRAGGRSRVRSASLLILAGVFLAGAAPSAHAQDLPQLFQRVSKSVVIVRAKGRDLVMQGGTSTPVKFNEVGSGVLVSTDGKVLTAAHVVQIADEVTVEILGGETVTARVVGSKVKADLALLQLARVPAHRARADRRLRERAAQTAHDLLRNGARRVPPDRRRHQT